MDESVMTNTRTLASIVFVTAVALTALPAQAGQHRGGGQGGGGQGGGGSRGAAGSRGGGQSGGGSRGAAVSRGGGVRGGVTASGGGRVQTRSNPVYRGGGVQARSNPVYRGGGVQARSYGGYRGAGVQTRSYGAYRGGGGVVRGGTRFGSARVIGGRSGFYRPYYSRPYYSFRPRLSLGFGLWVGYPVDYPYYYGDPYYTDPYRYAYPYPVDPYAYDDAASSYEYPAQRYPSSGQRSAYPRSNYPPARSGSGQDDPDQQPSLEAERGGQASARGGVSFEITPDSAAVFVDGTYVGVAGTFGPSSQPLGLISGRHHIEIRADGYRTMTFEADVRSGQVVPYQGTLQRD
jgi:hypothetical protein